MTKGHISLSPAHRATPCASLVRGTMLSGLSSSTSPHRKCHTDPVGMAHPKPSRALRGWLLRGRRRITLSLYPWTVSRISPFPDFLDNGHGGGCRNNPLNPR
jgi:hypothetical protein